jgi:hypothetical protein
MLGNMRQLRAAERTSQSLPTRMKIEMPVEIEFDPVGLAEIA